MKHLQQHLARTLAGEPQPTHEALELRSILADIRATVRDRQAQQTLGLYVLELVNAGLKSTLHAERAVMRAKGGRSA